MADLLEEPLQAPFKAWKTTPNPATTNALLTAVQPAMDKAIKSHVGNPTPLIKGHAKQLAIQAFQTYDPSKAGLHTHLSRQLQGLKRFNRQQSQPLRMPDRSQFELAHLHRGQLELEEQFGREPTYSELADHTGFSLKKIEQLHRVGMPVAESTFAGDESDFDLPARFDDERARAIRDLVHSELDPSGQKIMEWTLGLHGPVLPNKEVAARLGLTAGAISQRKARIQAQLDEMDQLSPF